MSALPPKADIRQWIIHVGEAPRTEILDGLARRTSKAAVQRYSILFGITFVCVGPASAEACHSGGLTAAMAQTDGMKERLQQRSLQFDLNSRALVTPFHKRRYARSESDQQLSS